MEALQELRAGSAASGVAAVAAVSAFRKAMSSFPTGVTVVTVAAGDDAMYGVTVNSFTSVSLDPMLVLVCLNQNSRGIDHDGTYKSPRRGDDSGRFTRLLLGRLG